MDPETRTPRDARAEAAARLNDRFEVRVLEPSPPAIEDEWFADDPVGEANGSVVLPVGDRKPRWDDFCGSSPEFDAWCADHWLANRRRLLPVPAGYVSTRESLHLLAFYVLSPARQQTNGKMALRYTHRGFGTPFFGEDRQVRVEGLDLVKQDARGASAVPITSLDDAARFVGVDLDPGSGDRFDVPPLGDSSAHLDLSQRAASAVSDWFGFMTVVLEELRYEDPAAALQTRVQLWPEHFDVAVEFGDPELQSRASFGGSPGDEDHPDPYLYVAPWVSQSPDPFWSETHFGGARLSYEALLESDDQIATALRFFRKGKSLLQGGRV